MDIVCHLDPADLATCNYMHGNSLALSLAGLSSLLDNPMFCIIGRSLPTEKPEAASHLFGLVFELEHSEMLHPQPEAENCLVVGHSHVTVCRCVCS